MAITEEKVAQLLNKMEGLTVALATPLDIEGNLDIGSLNKLMESVIDGGASCLFPLGWAGEQPLLPRHVLEDMLTETIGINDGRLPVMVGVSEQSLPKALELAQMACEKGADLILATPPYSYPISQDLIFQYFRDLAAESSLPLVVYQNDEVGVRIDLETMVRLSDTPGIVAVKATLPFPELQRYFHHAHRAGRFAVISGDEYLYGAALSLGIRHFTMGGPGNFSPRWCTSIFESAMAGDLDSVRRKQKRLTDFCDAVYLTTGEPYAAVKYVIGKLGLCSPYITPPLRMLSEEQKKPVDAAIVEFKEILSAQAQSWK